MWRTVWATLDADNHILAFTFHHGIVDEWSLRVFFQELTLLYAANGDAATTSLPPLSLQFADYAAWQRQQLGSERLARQRAYWTEQLTALPPALELPTDRPRPARPSGQGGVHRFQIPADVVARVRQLAHEEGTSLFTLMLATYQVWLHRYTGQDDLIVGTPVAHRDRTELQSLLGFFLNTLPIRTQLDATQVSATCSHACAADGAGGSGTRRSAL